MGTDTYNILHFQGALLTALHADLFNDMLGSMQDASFKTMSQFGSMDSIYFTNLLLLLSTARLIHSTHAKHMHMHQGDMDHLFGYREDCVADWPREFVLSKRDGSWALMIQQRRCTLHDAIKRKCTDRKNLP